MNSLAYSSSPLLSDRPFPSATIMIIPLAEAGPDSLGLHPVSTPHSTSFSLTITSATHLHTGKSKASPCNTKFCTLIGFYGFMDQELELDSAVMEFGIPLSPAHHDIYTPAPHRNLGKYTWSFLIRICALLLGPTMPRTTRM